MRTMAAAALAAGAAMTAYAIGAAAQSVRSESGTEDQLRAVYATPVEVAEGKRIAASACARCHGADGVSKTKGIPHLAGQRAAYLDLQLRAYRHSDRIKGAMTGIVTYLSDDALVKVAAYYASLEPPPPAPAPKKAPTQRDPVQEGKESAAACGGCHGDVGISSTPGMPSLVALDPKYFASAISAYKSGRRKNDMMSPLAASLSEESAGNVALYYALQKPARATTQAAGDAAAGKAASSACAACHGDRGVSGNPATPSLAGQDAEYLAAAMKAYKDGSRNDDSMKDPAAALDEQSRRNLAAYYAAQQPEPLNVRRPLTTEEWTERCDRCHGPGGNSTDPMIPRLSAQRADWLEHVLEAYRSGARKSAAMSAMTALMSDADARALAAHYARQRAHAVTYIVLPPTGAKGGK